MDWYIPITIIPGIGLIILSTSNIMLRLNAEITRLENSTDDCSLIIKAKLGQLKILGFSIMLQYLGVLFFLLSGIANILFDSKLLPQNILIFGVSLITLSILLLLYYSWKAISIRQKHLNIK